MEEATARLSQRGGANSTRAGPVEGWEESEDKTNETEPALNNSVFSISSASE